MAMPHSPHAIAAALAIGFAAGCPAALAAPGEDAIILKGPVNYISLPGPSEPVSASAQGATDVPAWMRSRITRYVAKAYSAQARDGSIYTDEDVIMKSEMDGLRKTCIQEVGSNTLGSNTFGTRYGPSARDQVVVLRGDLVNLCR